MSRALLACCTKRQGNWIMPNAAESPLATYLAHLKRGELGYQFSPSAQQACSIRG